MYQVVPPTASSSSTGNFQAIFYASLKAYEQKTKKDLLAHPLSAQFQTCNSPADILAVLRDQVQRFEQRGNDTLTKWLNPTVNVLYAFSAVLGEGVGLVFSPAKVIFAGAGVLLLAARDAAASQDTLIDIFERIEHFFGRLEIYTEVPTTETMRDIIAKIMVEVLGIFAIVTKEIKQGRAKKYLKKLFGRTDIEDALSRLDNLTQEEAQMAIAQVLKVAHRVEDGVKTVGDDLKGVDDKINLALEDAKVVKVTSTKTNALVQQTANNMEEAKRSRVRRDHRAWLSPPDPSTNQNIACGAQYEGTATWFSQGSSFVEWKSESTTPLLWIHGKPGSGKSTLCSTIIQGVMALRDAGLASMAYFYFDFRDTDKQHCHNLLPSLLVQLSARSDSYCDILSRVHTTHDDGARKPSTSTLIACLKEMLALPGQGPVYIILDALDECTNTSGIPSARKQVLDLLKDLVGLHLSNLHICVTSRPEIDIRVALEPLEFHPISIHDQSGQKKDIEDYIRSVVYAESDTAMRRWRDRDKELVIKTLSERADGMFRWVFCQLEALQHCLPQSIRRTLDELPESLDKTYERVLKEISRANQHHAYRLLQCLTVAIRPLRVVELAEVLALDFDGPEGATPKLNEDWRSEDRQRDVLSVCSSLINLVDDGDGSRVIQFSHFSVKEFLTSNRLATSREDVSHFHIMPEPAHTTLARACLGSLLQLDGNADHNRVEDSFPLAIYASRHWVDHAQFGRVSLRIEDGMRRLFDSAKPYFAAWLQLHDIDDGWSWFRFYDPEYRASPLYYASLCGFRDLTAHIVVEHPDHVNARGGLNRSALVAALSKGHLEVAELLYQQGAVADVGCNMPTPLQVASADGLIEIVRWLLDHGADANRQQRNHQAPITSAASNGHLEVVRMLLGHSACSIDVADIRGNTPLHRASENGHVEIARLLLQHGADISAQDSVYSTPLHHASFCGQLEVARLLLDHGTNVNAKNKEGRTPLLDVSMRRSEIVSLLLDRGADTDAKDQHGWTLLHLTSSLGRTEIAHLLLDRGTNTDAENKDGWTPLHLASSWGKIETVRLLLDRGASADAKDTKGRTPSRVAKGKRKNEIVQMLTEHGAVETTTCVRETEGENPRAKGNNNVGGQP